MAQATVSAPAAQEAPKYANYRDFNNFSLKGRVVHSAVKSGQYGDYVSVTVVTNLADGQEGVAVQFNDYGSVLKLARGGHLMTGRQVHVTGLLTGAASHYEKDGQMVPLRRTRLQMQQVRLDLGAKPKSATGNVAA